MSDEMPKPQKKSLSESWLGYKQICVCGLCPKPICPCLFVRLQFYFKQLRWNSTQKKAIAQKCTL